MKFVDEFLVKFYEERQPTPENEADEFANWIGGVGQNMIEEDMRAAIAHNQVKVREDRPLKEVLAELDEEMLKLDDRLPGLFNPGLSLEEIKSTLQMEPVNPDLITLYAWHNGFIDEHNCDPLLFSLYRFMTLTEGLELKKALSDFIPSYFLPIMEDGCGNNLEISLTAEGEFGNIFCEHIHDDASSYYSSPAAYFSSLTACLREGAFWIREGAGDKGEDLLCSDITKKFWINYRYQLTLPSQVGYEGDEGVGDDRDSEDSVYSMSLPPRK